MVVSGVAVALYVATSRAKDGRDVRFGDHNMEVDLQLGSVGRSE